LVGPTNGIIVLQQQTIGKPYQAVKQCQENVNSKNRTVIDCLQLSDTTTRDDEKMTSFPLSCICIFWVNRPTQNLTG